MAKANEKLVRKNGLDLANGVGTQEGRMHRQMGSYSPTGEFCEVPETPKKNYPLSLIEIKRIRSRGEGNEFSQDNIAGLKESIRECGLIDPIQVLETEEDGYRDYCIIAGHRRFTAYSWLYEETKDESYQTIPAIVYQLTENKALDLTMDADCKKVFITKETEEKIYADSNLQSRQLTYAEVACRVVKEIQKLEDDEYRARVAGNNHKVDFSKIDRGKQISLILGDYHYDGWGTRTVQRFIDIYDLSKYYPAANQAVEEISKPYDGTDKELLTVATANKSLEQEIKFLKMLEASERTSKKFSSAEKSLQKKWQSAEVKTEELFCQLLQTYKDFSAFEEKPKKKDNGFNTLKKSMHSFLSKKTFTDEEMKELKIWLDKIKKINIDNK